MSDPHSHLTSRFLNPGSAFRNLKFCVNILVALVTCVTAATVIIQIKMNARIAPVHGVLDNVPHSFSAHQVELPPDDYHTCCLSSPSNKRFLFIGPFNSGAGLAHSFAIIGYAIELAIRHEIQVLFRGPIRVGHGVGAIDERIGITSSPLARNADSTDLDGCTTYTLPAKDASPSLWEKVMFSMRHNTSIIFQLPVPPFGNGIRFINGEWILPVPNHEPRKPPGCEAPGCETLRDVLAPLYFSNPNRRVQCQPFLSGNTRDTWIIAIHIRRGDIIKWRNGERLVHHQFYEDALRAVLGVISQLDRNATVSILVFSEGLHGSLVNENGAPISWDIASTSCANLSLTCTQIDVFDTTTPVSHSLLDEVDCMVEASILIGGRSGLSHLAGTLSRNVKVVPTMWNVYPREHTMLLDAPVPRLENYSFTIDHGALYDLIANWRKHAKK